MRVREKKLVANNFPEFANIVKDKDFSYFNQNRMETILTQKNIQVSSGNTVEETLKLILQAASNLK